MIEKNLFILNFETGDSSREPKIDPITIKINFESPQVNP